MFCSAFCPLWAICRPLSAICSVNSNYEAACTWRLIRLDYLALSAYSIIWSCDYLAI